MKLFYLADGASVHTKKWVISLLKKGHNIHLFSLNAFDPQKYDGFKENFSFTVFDLSERKTMLGGLNKLSYYSVIKDLKKAVTCFDPDLIHAHFASSYGMLAAKIDFHPLIISVWGYDVFHFPKRSFFHKRILIHNLTKADKILSTSHVMAEETSLYTDKPIEVTPFGIDTEHFKPKPLSERSTFFPGDSDDFIIGTAKALEDKYAIDDLIRSFAILVKQNPQNKIKLIIAGEGSAEQKLIKLAKNLGVNEKIKFLGYIDHSEIPDFYNSLDVFVALSLEESFGVSIIEAGACGKPVVVSDAEGLPEVVENGETGFVVSARNPAKAAQAIEMLLRDNSLKEKMGIAGRKRALYYYDWNKCVEQMHSIYLCLKKND